MISNTLFWRFPFFGVYTNQPSISTSESKYFKTTGDMEEFEEGQATLMILKVHNDNVIFFPKLSKKPHFQLAL